MAFQKLEKCFYSIQNFNELFFLEIQIIYLGKILPLRMQEHETQMFYSVTIPHTFFYLSSFQLFHFSVSLAYSVTVLCALFSSVSNTHTAMYRKHKIAIHTVELQIDLNFFSVVSCGSSSFFSYSFSFCSFFFRITPSDDGCKRDENSLGV